MGREKERLIKRDKAWDEKARREGIKCMVCSQPIPFDERQVYFEKKLCGYCAHQASKDD